MRKCRHALFFVAFFFFLRGWISRKSYQSWASPVAQAVKNLPVMQQTPVRSLGREDALERGMGAHCGMLVWRIPCARAAWRAVSPRAHRESDAE